MSFIIQGIDLPKDGEWLSVIIKPTKEVIVDTIRYGDYALLNTEYGSAIQIPSPHGRLGDLDIAIKNIEESISYVNNELNEYKSAENKDNYVDNYDIKMINEMAGLISAQVDIALIPILLEKEE